jgi:hypothetical protein
VRGLRGGKALSNFKDIDADIKVPRLECLGALTVAAVLALISNLFVVSVTAFLTEGSLHVVLRTCTASLIMHHRRVTAEFGYVNAVVTKLRNSARSAGITDTRFPNKSPESILDDWSDIIQKDYEDRNPEMTQATPDLVQLAAVLNQQSQLLMQLTAGVNDIKTELASEQRKNSNLENDVALLSGQLATVNRKLAVFKTPPTAVDSSSASRRRRHAEVDQPGDDGGGGGNKSRRLEDPAEVLVAQSGTAPEQARARSGTALSAARVPRQELWYGAEARDQEASTNKNKYVSIVLQDLYRTGHLKALVWKDIAFPKHYTEHSSLKNTLELVEIVMTHEERRAFTADGTSATDLERHGQSIEKKCMNQMLVYEGGDPEVEAQTGTTKKGTYLALGNRVRKYRNELKKMKPGDSEPPLQDRPPAPAAATPPGQRSIGSFFRRSNA